MDNDFWKCLIDTVHKIGNWFPDGVVFIDGVAAQIWAPESRLALPVAATACDADLAISRTDFADLRDLEAVVSSRRLDKQLFFKGGFAFGVHVEGQHKLAIPVSDIIAASTVRNGIRVAALGHLLTLKLDAFQRRRGTPKGDQHADDIARIILCLKDGTQAATPAGGRSDLVRIDDVRRALLDDAVADETLLRLCRDDARQVRQLHDQIRAILQDVDRMRSAPSMPVAATSSPSEGAAIFQGTEAAGRLSLAPIAPPTIQEKPVGTVVSFRAIVQAAGMRNVTDAHPEVRIHDGAVDVCAVQPGRRICCIAAANLPSEPRERAREIIRRLAYGFMEYAARETVARMHRDLAREAQARASSPT